MKQITAPNEASKSRAGVIDISPYRTSQADLIAPRSFMNDRFEPECEHVVLAQREVQGGTLRYAIEDGAADHQIRRGRIKSLLSKSKRTRVHSDKVIFDFRLRTPENWAHFLNNHLPIFFAVSSRLDVEWDDLLIVLPADIPEYITRVADHFGLKTLLTDDVIVGQCVRFDADPWTSIRCARAQWVQQEEVSAKLASRTSSDIPLPLRVFLTRRDTRRITNSSEVEALLDRYGFTTLCPEDLSVHDQFRLFQEVEYLVAVHGAGLAPLLYRTPDSALKQLIEILPCGHMTDVYRVMAEQVGCAWIGIRGKAKPEYVQPAYDFKSGFTAFSLDDFEVDLDTLELAFSKATYPLKESNVA